MIVPVPWIVPHRIIYKLLTKHSSWSQCKHWLVTVVLRTCQFRWWHRLSGKETPSRIFWSVIISLSCFVKVSKLRWRSYIFTQRFMYLFSLNYNDRLFPVALKQTEANIKVAKAVLYLSPNYNQKSCYKSACISVGIINKPWTLKCYQLWLIIACLRVCLGWRECGSRLDAMSQWYHITSDLGTSIPTQRYPNHCNCGLKKKKLKSIVHNCNESLKLI